MKRIRDFIKIVISTFCLVLVMASAVPHVAYAYTDEEKAAVKAWLIANGYPPTMAGAEQAYADYLAGKFDAPGGNIDPVPVQPAETKDEVERASEEDITVVGEYQVEETKAAEEIKKAEETEVAEEIKKAEEEKAAEEARKAEEEKAAEEARKAEEIRKMEEEKKAEEEAKKIEEERKAEEEAKRAEEERLAAEAAKRAEEEAIIQAAKNRRANIVMLMIALAIVIAGISGMVYVMLRRRPV